MKKQIMGRFGYWSGEAMNGNVPQKKLVFSCGKNEASVLYFRVRKRKKGGGSHEEDRDRI